MFVVDAHLDLAYTLLESPRDFSAETEVHSLSLPALRQGEVGFFFATIFAAGEWQEGFDGVPSQEQFVKYNELFQTYPTDLAPAGDLAALDLAREGGRMAVTFLLEGADPLRSVAELADFHRKGVRFLGPAWNNKNPYASGINTKEGLSDAGRELVDEMNRLGIAADISHLNPACFWEVVERTSLPCFASHSNARAVTDIPRNIDDKQIDAIAKSGGVIGLNFYEGFMRRSGRKGRANADDLMAHVDHLFDRVGAGRVGIGSDYDGGFGPSKVVEGFETPAKFSALASLLSERGYSDEDVHGVMGGNFLDYLQRVWGESP